ncbi:hypothetical protein VTI74DRAFT_3263 [Chaetomium olivicolor]
MVFQWRKGAHVSRIFAWWVPHRIFVWGWQGSVGKAFGKLGSVGVQSVGLCLLVGVKVDRSGFRFGFNPWDRWQAGVYHHQHHHQLNRLSVVRDRCCVVGWLVGGWCSLLSGFSSPSFFSGSLALALALALAARLFFFFCMPRYGSEQAKHACETKLSCDYGSETWRVRLFALLWSL